MESQPTDLVPGPDKIPEHQMADWLDSANDWAQMEQLQIGPRKSPPKWADSTQD